MRIINYLSIKYMALPYNLSNQSNNMFTVEFHYMHLINQFKSKMINWLVKYGWPLWIKMPFWFPGFKCCFKPSRACVIVCLLTLFACAIPINLTTAGSSPSLSANQYAEWNNHCLFIHLTSLHLILALTLDISGNFSSGLVKVLSLGNFSSWYIVLWCTYIWCDEGREITVRSYSLSDWSILIKANSESWWPPGIVGVKGMYRTHAMQEDRTDTEGSWRWQSHQSSSICPCCLQSPWSRWHPFSFPLINIFRH